MQNCYVGDVGDFLKYSLLTFLQERDNLKLGVNWYQPAAEDDNGNGKYINYLKPDNRIGKRLRECNPKLYDQLLEIVCVKKKRAIKEIENGKILPLGIIFFGEQIEKNDIERRKRWHSAALTKLKRADFVFLDPDNGIEKRKMSLAQNKSPKHVSCQEIVDYYSRCQSVIIYNHKSMEQKKEYEERFRELKRLVGKEADIRIVRAHRGTARDFVLLISPKQKS